MKKSWMLLFALGIALPVGAQSVAPFRGDDPFVFCTQGYELTIAQMCWVPLPPYTGGAAWTYTWECDEPNEYGRPWTPRDRLAFSIYEAVCPLAITPGPWTGPGDGSEVPLKH